MINTRCMFSLAAVLLLAAMLFSSCARQPVPQPDSASPAQESSVSSTVSEPAVEIPDDKYNDNIYSIWVRSNEFWSFDQNGKRITWEEPLITLNDIFTGEPQCQYRSHVSDSGERNADGYPIVKRMTALYDMQGNLLYDWQNVDYDAAYGDFIIKRGTRYMMSSIDDLPPDYKTELWNFKTGETVLDGVGHVEKLGDNLLVTDQYSSPVWIINFGREKLIGFPPPKKYGYSYAWNGYIIAQPENKPNSAYKTYLLDANFNELLCYDSIYSTYNGLKDNLLIYQQGDETGIVSTTGEKIYIVPKGAAIDYCDGEVAIIRDGELHIKEKPPAYSLRTVDGKLIADGFSYLTYESYQGENQKISEHFIGLKGGYATLLSRSGEELASAKVPEGCTYVGYIGSGYYSFSIEGETESNVGIMDSNLNIVIPIGRYSYIYTLRNNLGGNPWPDEMDRKLLVAVQLEKTYRRVDILDAHGNIVIENLTNVQSAGPNRIGVLKGFYAGLMDWDGNWIAKESIFNEIIDD